MPSAGRVANMALVLFGTLAFLYCTDATTETQDGATAEAHALSISSREEAARALRLLLKKKTSFVIKKKPHLQKAQIPPFVPPVVESPETPLDTLLSEKPKTPFDLGVPEIPKRQPQTDTGVGESEAEAEADPQPELDKEEEDAGEDQ